MGRDGVMKCLKRRENLGLTLSLGLRYFVALAVTATSSSASKIEYIYIQIATFKKPYCHVAMMAALTVYYIMTWFPS